MSTNEKNNGLLIHLSHVWHPYDTIFNSDKICYKYFMVKKNLLLYVW